MRNQYGRTTRVPGWAQPVWTVSDGSVAEVVPDGTLGAMENGRVDVTARLAGLTANRSYCISPALSALSLPLIYLTQAAQNRQDSTPLIAGRPALLRIFLVADPPGDIAPEVQVTLLQDEDVVFEHLAVPKTQIPDSVDESTLDGSLNVEIPGSALQSGNEYLSEQLRLHDVE